MIRTDHRTFRYQAEIGFKQPTDWQSSQLASIPFQSETAESVNAPIESLWGLLQVGRLYGMRFETRRQTIDEVIDWLKLLQPQKIAFDAELHQSNEV